MKKVLKKISFFLLATIFFGLFFVSTSTEIFYKFIKFSENKNNRNVSFSGEYKVLGSKKNYKTKFNLLDKGSKFFSFSINKIAKNLPERVDYSAFDKKIVFQFNYQFYQNFFKKDSLEFFKIETKNKTLFEILKSEKVFQNLWGTKKIEKKDYEIIFPAKENWRKLKFLESKKMKFSNLEFLVFVFQAEESYEIGSFKVENFEIKILQNVKIFTFIDSETGAPLQIEMKTNSEAKIPFFQKTFFEGNGKIDENTSSYKNYINSISLFGNLLKIFKILRFFFLGIGTIFLFLFFKSFYEKRSF